MSSKSVEVTAFAMILSLWMGCMGDGRSDLSDGARAAVQDSVRAYAERVAEDVTQAGPEAWLRHFERSPDFFMATDGMLLFPDNDSAATFVRDLATRIRRIDLRWQHMRVDPLSERRAVIASNFTETIEDSGGTSVSIAGYFTAVTDRTDEGWKLRNAHWSLYSGQRTP